MKITGIEPRVVHVNHRGDWVFVCVHTDAGITGAGEASHSGNDALLLSTLEYMATQINGRDPGEIQTVWRQLARLNGGRIAATALSAIEQALWDIQGQRLETPVHRLFGGALTRQAAAVRQHQPACAGADAGRFCAGRAASGGRGLHGDQVGAV